MSAQYTTRPLSDRTWLRPDGARVWSQFSAIWSDTIALLIREVFALQDSTMPGPVIEVDVRERDIRIDGALRADARADSPAVLVAFESKHGPLIYRCDRYRGGSYRSKMSSWQHNARAIALTLEALRAVDRYGATSKGEQYRGFKALPAGSGALATHMTSDEAVAVLRKWAPPSKVDEPPGRLARWARIGAHPDRHGGDHGPTDDVLRAIAALGLPS